MLIFKDLSAHKYKLFFVFSAILAISVFLNLNKPQIFAQTTTADLLVQEDDIPDDIVAYTDPTTAQNLFDASMKSIDSIPSVRTSTDRPNIVVIMLDDVNPIDGRFWTRERTPAIYNNIISKGINFREFYGETSLCCPGRVGFLTGQHTQNHGVADLDGTKFNPKESIAVELQKKGYYTMLTGKYVNYFAEIPRNKAVPPGWNKFDAIYENQGHYYRYRMISKKGTDETITYYGSDPFDYSTDVFNRTAVKRLKEAPANKPIFAYVTPYAIHNPRTVAPRYINSPRCNDIPAWKAADVFEQDVSDKAAFYKDLKAGNIDNGYGLRRDCEVFLAVDDLVKKIKFELDNQGRLNNTVFILTADNGYGFGEHRLPSKTSPHTTHIPLYISWPAGRGTTPTINNTTLSNIDLAATLCDLAGCVMGPYPNGQTKTDGVSFLPLLKNESVTLNRDVILESQPIKPLGTDGYTRPTWWAVRTTNENPYGLWHYIEYATGEKELYDLSNGPCFDWRIGQAGDPCELDNALSPNSKRATPTNANDIKNYLAARLRQLKNERGFTPFMPSIATPTSPTPTVTVTPSTSPTLTISPTPTP